MRMKEWYHEKLDSQLEEWNSRIDLLALAWKRNNADAKVEHQKQIKELRHKLAALQKKVAQLKQTRGKTWVDLKNNVEKGEVELKASLDKALLRYV